MRTFDRLILIAVFPLLLFCRILNFLLQRDPLRLREPSDATCWIERGVEASRVSYFSEASEQEGRNHRGLGGLANLVLAWIAGRCAPPRISSGDEFHSTVERDREIPDEVYTLW